MKFKICLNEYHRQVDYDEKDDILLALESIKGFSRFLKRRAVFKCKAPASHFLYDTDAVYFSMDRLPPLKLLSNLINNEYNEYNDMNPKTYFQLYNNGLAKYDEIDLKLVTTNKKYLDVIAIILFKYWIYGIENFYINNHDNIFYVEYIRPPKKLVKLFKIVFNLKLQNHPHISYE